MMRVILKSMFAMRSCLRYLLCLLLAVMLPMTAVSGMAKPAESASPATVQPQHHCGSMAKAESLGKHAVCASSDHCKLCQSLLPALPTLLPLPSRPIALPSREPALRLTEPTTSLWRPPRALAA